MPSEDSTGPRNRRSNSPPLANPTLVYSSPLSTYRQPSDSTMLQNPPDTVSQRCTSPLDEPAAAYSLQTLRQTFEQRGISSQATDIIIQSWTSGTQKQYQAYIKKWLEFCHGRENNPYDPPIATVLDFLVSLHEKGLGYSTLNTAMSAISVIVLPHNDITIGSNLIISTFMKGIFKINPSTPRYKTTWDPHIVLNYLSSLGAGDKLTLKLLSMKLLMTTALVSAQRGQSLHMLDIRFMKEGETV